MRAQAKRDTRDGRGPSRGRSHWPRGLRLLAVLAGLVVPLLLPAAAQAHLLLRRAEPAVDARLDAAPEALRLAFSQPIELAFSRIVLIGPTGEVELADAARAADDARVLVAGIRGPLVAGAYTVRWQVAGPDGHPVRGEYGFTLEPGATGLAVPADPAGPTAPGQAPPPPEHHADALAVEAAFGAGSAAYAAVRWLTFVGLLGMIGAVAFRLLVLGLVERSGGDAAADLVPRAGRAAAGLGIAALALLALALVLRLFAQSVALHGAADAASPERLAMMVTRTLWGWGWLIQAAGIVAGLAGLLVARRGSGAGWALALVGALALAFSPALAGHAIAAERLAAVAVVADALHVLGAGGWLGSLLLVVAVGIPVALGLRPERRGAAVAELIRAFSPTALAFAALVLATGLFASWLHLGSAAALWESGYGRVLLLKLAALAVVFGTGAYNWLRVKPSLGTEIAVTRLRRSATLELAVAVLVLAVTAVLVATPPPAEAEAAQAAGDGPGAHPATRSHQ